MEHARQHGFPVPAVRDANGPEMVVARLRGRTMAAELARRPWRLGAHAALLGDLHRRLQLIDAPDALAARVGEGSALLHLDLHPGNVLLTAHGPWVIDWANAARGPAAADIAMTFLIVGAVPDARSPPGRIAGVLRRRFAHEFLVAAGSEGVHAALDAVAACRMADPNLKPDERAAVGDLASRIIAGTRGGVAS